MFNITFITTNITKLAHARYLSSKYNINILHHKKKYYGVSYKEPRISNQEQLIKDSMNDAIKRWRKVASENSTQLFFIEDTSVRIEALSDEENEIPGTEIKYWMLDYDFNKLDNELKKKNNNRKVSVTSHVVLFLSKELKKISSINEEYLIFESTSSGSIVDKEQVFETNIIYPWLDNKTFNKWFVPNNFNIPISMLDILEADIGDFRRNAFNEMFNFIEKYYNISKINNIVFNAINYLPFSPLFLICGPTCTGKSTIGKYMLDTYGYYHIEASDFMTLKYLETHGVNCSIDKHRFAAELLKVKPLVVVENIIKYINEKNIKDKIIITGFRNSKEIFNLFKIFVNQDIKLIYINTDIKTRFNRWIKRKRDIVKYTLEYFEEINNTQNEMGLQDIQNMENIKLFDNDKEGLDIFYTKFNNTFINNDLSEDKKIFIPNTLQKTPLEKAILIALAIKYENNEYNYYTTTEISYLINKLFQDDKNKKNKNNISRYFNQSFYPYYEIKKEKNKIKYKLSPTGYSEAKYIFHSSSTKKNEN